MKPDDPENLKLISTGNSGSYVVTDPDKFNNGKVSIITDDEVKEFSYASLAMNTTIEMHNLKVESVYTTDNEDSSSYGAMTLTCKSGDQTVTVRTIPLTIDGELVTEDYFKGKTIDVRGIVDYYDGGYQIKLFTLSDVQTD